MDIPANLIKNIHRPIILMSCYSGHRVGSYCTASVTHRSSIFSHFPPFVYVRDRCTASMYKRKTLPDFVFPNCPTGLSYRLYQIAMELSGSLIKVYHVLFLIINKCMSFSVCVLKNFLSNPISVLTISKVFSQISNFILFNVGRIYQHI